MNDPMPDPLFNDVPPPSADPASAGERVAFCQDCGRPLTSSTVRSVAAGPNAGVFCDPCLGRRVAAPYGTPPPAGPVTGVSHPVLAALLGFIPGVGAMYNGQYAKGFVHLIVFAVLVSLKDGINDVFGLLVAGWIFYMVFDAYQTARAYRDGLPLPNPFHLNEVGERFGFGRNPAPYWKNAAPANPATNPAAAGGPPGSPATAYAPPYSAGPAASGSWTGYVPPTPAGSQPPYAPSQGWASAPAPGTAAGYTQTTAWSSQAPTAAGVPAAIATEEAARRSRIPAAALWLIGLGVLILLANLLPNFSIDGRWVLPVILAALSVFVFTRSYGRHTRLVCALRWPVILMVLALLFTLQAADVANLGRTWPVLIISIGVLLLLERVLGNAPAVAPESAAATFPAAAPGTSIVPRVDWSEPQSDLSAQHDDSTKGGY